MHVTWRADNERRNIRKRALDVSLARGALSDPRSETIWDGVVNGEERWRTFGTVAVGGRFKVVVGVDTYPDPDDETRIHVIGLREATSHDRRRYEIPHF